MATKYAFLAVTVFAALSLAIPMVGSAFAISADKEYTPTQTNAYASYNNGTNQIQISWDFDTMTLGDKCVIKMDIEYQARATVDEVPRVATAHYIPNYYSAISSSPTVLGSNVEEVECEDASFRIDLNTIMNSSLNPDNLDNLMIFLSFYATDDLTNISIGDADRIDEVFVVYSPNEALVDGGANDQIQWACDKQIGSVLYIDQSGSGGTIIAHGNNGDNCDKYLYLENNQWIDIGMVDYPGLVKGETNDGFHVAGAYSLLIEVYTTVYRGGGGGCSDCTAPWLGKDSNGVLQVEGGITINGVQKDGGLYHTEYPMIYTNINDENTVTLIYQENQGPTNIMLVQLASVKEVGTSLGESQWMIEVWLNDFRSDISNPTIKEIIINDDYNLLVNVNATVSLVQCKADSVDREGCLSTTFTFTNIQIPYYPVLVAEAIDYKNNSFQNFFNDGLQVVDPYYVEPTPPEPYKYECKDPIQKVMNRSNCNFNNIILSEANRALTVLTH